MRLKSYDRLQYLACNLARVAFLDFDASCVLRPLHKYARKV